MELSNNVLFTLYSLTLLSFTVLAIYLSEKLSKRQN